MTDESLVVCNKCRFVKPVSHFYKNDTISGYDSTCKECRKQRVRENRREKIEQYTAYEKSRAQLPHRKEARREYQRTDRGQEAHVRANKAYRKRSPTKAKAHTVASNALRDGKLIRAEACEKCGSSEKIEGHHDDYSKPLDVKWLCEQCHKEWHKFNVPLCPDAA